MHEKFLRKRYFRSFILLTGVFLTGTEAIHADAITFPAKEWGICFGNSPRFNGLRFNFMDQNVDIINGVNVTFWKPKEKYAGGTVNGLSLGLMPYADRLNGINLGLVGCGAREDLYGINIGLIGAGSGGNIKGINIGGIGAGAGGNIVGINIGGIGAGAGDDMTGINIGGIGAGAGGSLTGISLGGIGVGAGEHVTGISIAGIAVGAGDTLTGVALAGIAAGASTVKGIAIAGAAVGGEHVSGLAMALGTVMVVNDGDFKGVAISVFNNIRGTQRGVAIGIVNYAYRLKGVQIGLVNIVRDHPPGRIVLPIINIGF